MFQGFSSFFSLVLGLSLVTIGATSLPNPSFASTPSGFEVFPDVQSPASEEAFGAIHALRASGIIEGYPDGYFYPERNINRAEFLKLVMFSSKDLTRYTEGCATTEFSDVQNPSEWYYAPICGALEAGIVEGYEDGTFGAFDPINARDAAKIVVEAYDLQRPNSSNTPTEDTYQELIGLTEEQARDRAEELGAPFRVVERDGEPLIVTADYVFGRISAVIEDGRVVDYTLESEALVDDSLWFREYIDTVLQHGAYPPSIDDSADLLTRGQMAQMIWALQSGEDIAPGEDLLSGLSCEALDAQLTRIQLRRDNGYTSLYPVFDTGRGEILEAELQASDTASAPVSAGSTASQSFTGTNVQISGLDEADIVKTNGAFAAVVEGSEAVHLFEIDEDGSFSEVAVFDYDTQRDSPESETELIDPGFYYDPSSEVISGVYLTDDQLVVLSTRYDSVVGEPVPPLPAPVPEDAPSPLDENLSGEAVADSEEELEVIPPIGEDDELIIDPPVLPFYTYETLITSYVRSYNLSDLELAREYVFSGSLDNSRLIQEDGELVLTLSQSLPRDFESSVQDILPFVSFFEEGSVSEAQLDCEEVSLIPNTDAYSLSHVVRMSLTGDDFDHTAVIGGSSYNVSMSGDSLYMWQHVREETMIAPMNDDDTVVSPILYWGYEPKTRLYRFDLQGSSVEAIGTQTVIGSPLNQFSLDEHDGYLRVATQTQNDFFFGRFQPDAPVFLEEEPSATFVTILDADMEIVGEIADIAPGERMQSVRFWGDRGYLVTFEQVDPLFVLDLADPRDPEILGELKITGFSQYLHPVDEDHLLGFGVETSEPESGEPVRQTGLKMTLFDVSDPTNPTEKFVEELGASGSSSGLQYDHRALYWDPARGLMGFPASLTEDREDQPWPQTSFSGAAVYEFDVETGFTQRGLITHFEADESETAGADETYLFSDWGRNISRIFRVNDTLYTSSNRFFQSHDLETLNLIQSEEVSEETDLILVPFEG